MDEIGTLLLSLLGVGFIGCVFRFGWELAGGLAKRLLTKVWPSSKLEIRYGTDNDGRVYRWVIDDYGRASAIERAPWKDKGNEDAREALRGKS